MSAITETDIETAARLSARGWSAARILSGLGHPGYGQTYSRRVLALMVRYGLSAGEAIYGGIDAARKMEAAR